MKAMLVVTNRMKSQSKCFRVAEAFLSLRQVYFSCGSPLRLRI